jgi:hypothetical protein
MTPGLRTKWNQVLLPLGRVNLYAILLLILAHSRLSGTFALLSMMLLSINRICHYDHAELSKPLMKKPKQKNYMNMKQTINDSELSPQLVPCNNLNTQ